jgi:hypothetical protein
MPRVGFEPMTPVFERPQTVHALARAATVIGAETHYKHIIDIIQIITSLKNWYCSVFGMDGISY